MSTKTENHEISQVFLWQISLLTLVVIAVIVYSTRYFYSERSSPVQDTQTLLLPWLVAARHTLENGLDAFSGKSPKAVGMNEIARALAALLIGSIVCPTVFLLGWRRRRLSYNPEKRRPPLSLSVTFYGLCTAVTVYIAASMFPITVSSELVRTSLRVEQGVQSNRDAIISEINELARNAYQFYLLPKELGGGGRGYEQFVLPLEVSKTEAAQYVMTPGRKEIMIRASSVPFDDSSVEVKLDSTGRLAGWSYVGRFR